MDNGIYIITTFEIESKAINSHESFVVEKYDVSGGYFFKCIHFKGDIGIFIYYLDDSKDSPVIIFKTISSIFAIGYYQLSSIILSGYSFNKDVLLNDIEKISEEKISFISTTDTKEKLIVVMIHLFIQDQNIKIRYYSLEIYKLFNYKFFSDLNVHPYNNKYVTMASSFC